MVQPPGVGIYPITYGWKYFELSVPYNMGLGTLKDFTETQNSLPKISARLCIKTTGFELEQIVLKHLDSKLRFLGSYWMIK